MRFFFKKTKIQGLIIVKPEVGADSRGSDRYNHFESEPRPSRDMDPDFVALHKQITERNAQILYRGTDVKSYNDPAALSDRRS